MNATPSSERIHIGIFGKRNAGKSSLINALTGQPLSIVSDVAGTTTDPVQKAMELLPLGPVVLIDTPGIDDQGGLGSLRVARSYQMLNKSDIAVLVVDGRSGLTSVDMELLRRIRGKELPAAIVVSQCDRTDPEQLENVLQEIRLYMASDSEKKAENWFGPLAVSAATGYHMFELKEALAALMPDPLVKKRIAADLLQKGKYTVLVIPIDQAAPKGRLILPQQQTIRDILDAGGACITVRDTELQDVLADLGDRIGLVITDSQVFGTVSALVPRHIPLTSFSILFARYKGELEPFMQGLSALEQLEDGDRVLIAEGCTHHRQCDDIGTVKIPRWLENETGKTLSFDFSSGGGFPEDLSPYRLIIHCGGCMLNEREMHDRIARAREAGKPITNYGMLIARLKGILDRSLEPLRRF